MSRLAQPKPERIYVKVLTAFDRTGYMSPAAITWADGRTFWIDRVRDLRPAGTAGNGPTGDCYTVEIGGQERKLFFERLDQMYPSRVGRWFVEKNGA